MYAPPPRYSRPAGIAVKDSRRGPGAGAVLLPAANGAQYGITFNPVMESRVCHC